MSTACTPPRRRGSARLSRTSSGRSVLLRRDLRTRAEDRGVTSYDTTRAEIYDSLKGAGIDLQKEAKAIDEVIETVFAIQRPLADVIEVEGEFPAWHAEYRKINDDLQNVQAGLKRAPRASAPEPRRPRYRRWTDLRAGPSHPRMSGATSSGSRLRNLGRTPRDDGARGLAVPTW